MRKQIDYLSRTNKIPVFKMYRGGGLGDSVVTGVAEPRLAKVM